MDLVLALILDLHILAAVHECAAVNAFLNLCSHSVMNYALALTSVSWRLFACATVTATVPYTLLFTYVGSASSDALQVRGMPNTLRRCAEVRLLSMMGACAG